MATRLTGAVTWGNPQPPGFVYIHLPELMLPPVEANLRDVVFLTDRLNALQSPVRLAQDADLIFRRIPLSLHRLVLSLAPD
jgi:hypothetical protein